MMLCYCSCFIVVFSHAYFSTFSNSVYTGENYVRQKKTMHRILRGSNNFDLVFQYLKPCLKNCLLFRFCIHSFSFSFLFARKAERVKRVGKSNIKKYICTEEDKLAFTMRWSSFYHTASRVFHEYPSWSKSVVVCTVMIRS